MFLKLTSWADIDVYVGDEILDGFNDFLEEMTFGKFGFEHC